MVAPAIRCTVLEINATLAPRRAMKVHELSPWSDPIVAALLDKLEAQLAGREIGSDDEAAPTHFSSRFQAVPPPTHGDVPPPSPNIDFDFEPDIEPNNGPPGHDPPG